MKFLFKQKLEILLFLIVLLGFVLRFWRLDTNPPSLNWDEVSHGYNAYSILKTGSDEWGRLPLANFRAYGDYPLPANLYLAIPSISVFGLNEFGIRAPHALLGGLTVLSCFFLVQGLGFGIWVGLLASFLVAIDPWTLFPSRFVVQSNISFFLITTGLALFLHRRKKAIFLPLAGLALGVSVYAYHNARIFVPLLLVSLIILYRSEWRKWWQKRRTQFIFAATLLLVFFLPLIPIALGSEAQARAQWVSIIDQGAINHIIESRAGSNLPPFLSRLVYNRPTYFLSHFWANYLGYFSPRFLFFAGGTQYQFNVPGKGVLYPVEMPFFYLGLGILVFGCLRKSFPPQKRTLWVAFLWLLLSLIPAAITSGSGHVIRATTVLPLPQILVALGFFQFCQPFKNRRVAVLFSVFFIFAIFALARSYLMIYFGSYRRDYSWSWQYGYKEAVYYIKQNYDRYNKIIFTKKYGEPHEFVLFYWPWDPDKYKKDENLARYFRTGWYWVDSFAKFEFVNDWEVIDKLKIKNENLKITEQDSRILLITSPGNYSGGWKKIKTIDFLDGKPAFEILER